MSKKSIEEPEVSHILPEGLSTTQSPRKDDE